MKTLKTQAMPPPKGDLSYADFLTRLLRAEWHQQERPEGAVARYSPELGTGNLSLCQATGVNRRQIRTFAELDFIPKAENMVFVGKPAWKSGRRHPAQALEKLRRQFIHAQDLFDEMYIPGRPVLTKLIAGQV